MSSIAPQTVQQTISSNDRQIAFIDAGLPNYQLLIDQLPEHVEVVLVQENQDGIQVIADWAQNHSEYSAIHILGHGASGVQALGRAQLSTETLSTYQDQLKLIGGSLTQAGDILLYGCNVAEGKGGLSFIGSLADATGADIAASDDLSGSQENGANWTLEVLTAPVVSSISFNGYSSVLAKDIVQDASNTLYVRPNETSYIWTWGEGQGYNWTTEEWYDAAITQVSMDNVPDPGFEWYLDRGYFQYSTNDGASWSTYNMGDGFTNVSGTLWRFVDTQTHTSDDRVGFYYYVTGATTSSGGSGLLIKADEAPTDISNSNASGTLVSDTPDGEVVATLDPTDTGYTRDGLWVLESQSHTGLFTLQSDTSSNDNASLLVNTANLPAEGTEVSISVRYYDLYQLDRDGTPLAGEGISKTYTYTVKGPSDDLGFSDEVTVNSLVGDTVNQDFSSVTELTTGNFVVTWSDNTNGGVYAQLFNASGVAQGAAITVDSNVTYKSDAVALSGGKFAVFYVYPSTDDIAFRIIQADGTVGSEVQVAAAEWDSWSFLNAYASSDKTSFTLTWNTDDYSTLKKATYTETGSQTGSTTTLTPTGYAPVSAILSNDSVVTAVGDAASWAGLNLIINDSVIQSTYDNPIGDTATLHSLVALPTGGFVLAWADAASEHIQIQLFDNTGASTSSIIQADTATAGLVDGVKVSSFDDGSFVVTWYQDGIDGSGYSVQGRRFASDGTAIDTDQFQVNQYRYGNQSNSDVAALSNGTFVTTWTDGSDSSTGNNIELRISPTANDAPTLGGTPADTSVTEDSSVAVDLSAYDISDTDGDTITLTLSVDSGTLASTDGNGVVGGVTITNSDSASMTLQGSAADLNNYLNDTSKIQYTTAANSTTAITLTVTPNDGKVNGTADTLTISVTSVNDAPVLADTAVTLTSINEDAGDDDASSADGDNDTTNNADNGGDSVADLLTAAITDPDGAAIEAVAVIAVDNTHGVWQYSTDAGNSWSNFSETTGSSVDMSSVARLLDNNDLVRFVPDANFNGNATFTFRAWDASSGVAGGTADTTSNGGTTAFSADTDTASITVLAVNDAPIFTGLDGTPAFTEGGSAVQLDANACISDLELDALNSGNGDYTGATLTLVRNGGADASDQLSLASGGNLTVAGGPDGGGTVTAGGNVIANIADTGHGQLQLSFVDNDTIPTTALVNEVLQAVYFSNSSDDPASSVLLDVTINDGSDPSIGSVAVSITGVNDAPTLSATGQDPTYIEGATASDLFSGITADTVEAAQTFTGLTLTITNLADGSDEILSIDGSDLALTHGNSIATATNGLTVNASVSGSTATVSFNGASLSEAQLQTLVDGLAYRNSSDNPTTGGNRVVTLTALTDSGADSGDNVNNVSLNLQSTVSLTAVNDAPVLTGLDGDSVGLEPATSANIDLNADLTLSNADSSDYNGGSLVITDTGGNNTASGDFSLDGTTVTAGGDAVIAAGETVAVSGVAVGTVHATSDGQGGNTLQIDFNVNATSANLQVLLQNLSWGAAAGSGAQTFTATLDDADGTANSGDADTTANFAMVLGSRPVITGLDGDSVSFTEGGSPVLIDLGVNTTLTDADNPASFDGGQLSVSITANKAALEDLLSLDSSGNVSLSVTAATSTLSVDGTDVGTLVNDITEGNDLMVNLNTNATLARVQELLQSITYSNSSEAPTVNDRTLSVTLTDNEGLTSLASTIMVSVSAVNQAPVFSNVDATPGFTEDGAAVVLDANMTVADPELDAADNYSGATLTLQRNGGASEDDQFGNSGTLAVLTEGQALQVGAMTIGSVTANSAGVLTLSFNSDATSALVNAALQQITYANTSNTPDANVQIDLLFNDGNTGAQGSGGNLNDADDSITVSITTSNDSPVVETNTGVSLRTGRTITFTAAQLNEGDPDDNGTELTYTLDSLPTDGTLYLDTVELGLNDTFTQQDIDDGLLTFTAGRSAGNASFDISLRDGGEDGATAAVATVNVSVSAPPPPTPEPEPEPEPETPSELPDLDNWDELPDEDGDGVPESVEDFVTSPTGVSGDGNDDGVADRDQQDVASVPFRDTPLPSQNPTAEPIFVSLTGGTINGKSSATGSGVKLSNVHQQDAHDDVPDELDMPLGLIAFEADTGLEGGTETFSLYVDSTVAVNGYWKQAANGEWVNLASREYGGKVVLENSKLRLDFQLTDGGEFDADGEANGIIVDPGALGFGSDNYADLVQSLYIAYYQRPADSGGLNYWVDYLIEQGGSLENVVDAFANSEESQALYGDITNTSISGFLGDLYRALFDRSPEVDGLMFYRNAFLAGEYEDGRPATAGTLMLDILQGAQNSDADLVELKLDAARTFTWLLDPDQDGEAMATFDAGDLGDVRTWMQELAESEIAPGIGAVYDLIKDEVAEYGDSITLVGSDGVTELLF